MNNLSTMPGSIQEHLSEVQITSTGRSRESEVYARQAVAELARNDPGMCTFAIAISEGYTELTYTEREKRSYFERHSRSFLGIDLGTKYRPVTTTRVVQKRWTLR